jgi:hypothetical protein
MQRIKSHHLFIVIEIQYHLALDGLSGNFVYAVDASNILIVYSQCLS